MGEPVALVGIHGGRCFGQAAASALAAATVVVGSDRHLSSVPTGGARAERLGADLVAAVEQVAAWQAAGERVCVLVSGDPGFFGLARLAGARLGPAGLRIHPAPSSVSLAFARAGVNWDDAVVVSAHGRAGGLDAAAAAVMGQAKVAVLCAPDARPEDLGRRCRESGPRRVVVASWLGEADETVWEGDLAGLAGGVFDPLSVVICMATAGPSRPALQWGRPESSYQHRDGMITKAEVRAVALGKLGLPPAGVLWDIGAGSGSVSAECADLAPGLRIFAVERAEDDLAALRRNLDGRAVTVVGGSAPEALAELPDPDRVFVGGGGLEVLDAALARLRPAGRVVATFASLERAAAAGDRLGHMVQLCVSRAVPVGPDRSLRLQAENPVFVCWGPPS